MSSDSDSGSESDSDHGGNGNDSQDSPMMSIFASYYGIEDPVEDTVTKQKGTIDDANFDSDSFVRNVLMNESVEGLVAKDSEMVHEIRTLDGEMQKLVYDNYNKFITATETIKEMKNDVYGMDQDMDSVRLKMSEISRSSLALDEVLHEKRSQVDKLVRVRRLLHRLEFLSELPERLACMIDQRQYKEAVQLYNKTISVLTRHQHVLSFKNIKERTELMMRDMTVKVMNMLDDCTLEDVKLTQYVTVLCLMNAPRTIVMEKLLAAHRHRSMNMITQFNASLLVANCPATEPLALKSMSEQQSASMTSATSLVMEMLTQISDARRFAQSLVVGLIEACKGTYDLFQPQSSLTSVLQDQQAENLAREADARVAYAGLRKMIASIMGEYTKSMTAAFQAFFARYQSHFLSIVIDYSEYGDELQERHSGEGSSADNEHTRLSNSSAGASASSLADCSLPQQLPDRDILSEPAGQEVLETRHAANEAQKVARFKSSELQEERANWMMLARQAINDVTYLDSTQHECRINCNYATAEETVLGHQDADSHSSLFADALLAAITAHCDVLQSHRISCYLQSVVAEMPSIHALCNSIKMPPSSGSLTKSVDLISRPRLGGRPPSQSSSTLGTVHSFAGGRDALADRKALQRQTMQVKKCVDRLVGYAAVSFTEAARDVRCVADICEAAHRENAVDTVVLTLVTKHCNRMAHSIEQLCGLTNCVCSYDSASNVLSWSNGTHSFAGKGAAEDNDLPQEDTTHEIYTEPPSSSTAPPTDTTKSFGVLNCFRFCGGGGIDDATAALNQSDSAVRQAYPLLFSAVLRSLLPRLLREINASLEEQDLPVVGEELGQFRTQCCNRLELTSQLLLAHFLEVNASHCAELLSCAQQEVFTANYLRGSDDSGGQEENASVGGKVIDAATFMDTAAVLCYAVLNEQPPQLKMPAMDRDLMRRGGTRSSVVGGGHHSLQLDIDRLFSQRIRVFDTVTASSTADFLLATIIKAALKSCLEGTRFITLNRAAYVQLQINATFIKQVTSCLVRDHTDCDSLVEQMLSAIFSRFTDASDISNAADGNEVAVIARAVGDAFARISDNTVLVARAI